MKVELTNMIMIQNPETLEVVVQNRTKYWKGISFPGGHVEEQESFVSSAIREAKEETGLDITNLRQCGIVHWENKENNSRYLVILYKTQTYTGELLKETEEGEVFWTSIVSIYDMQLTPGFATYLDLFQDDEYNEIYSLYQGDEGRNLQLF